MGGFGSGRPGRHVSIEGTQSYVLSAKPFNLARLPRGVRGKSEITFADGFEIEIGIYTGEPVLLVKHNTNDGRDELIEYAIPLEWSVPPYGGLRWWFQCPSTRRRCCKLYLPNGGRCFLSRRAYRLRYACQSETRYHRLLRKCRKLNRTLGGGGDPDWIPDRPKGMWQRTYERLVAKLEHHGGEADAAFLEGTVPLLARLGMWPPR
jgi:hypothetical protein